MSVSSGTASRWSLRVLGLGYVALLLLLPLVLIFYKTFEDGIAPPLEAITSENGLHAFKLTLLTVAIAVPNCGPSVTPIITRPTSISG